MNFNKLCLKYMLEASANKEEVGKRVHDELMVYIDNRKKDMKSDAYNKAKRDVAKIAKELNADTIMDDLMKLGEIVGLKDSYSRLVGRVLSIVNELEDVETTKSDVLGEPEAEPEAEEEPEA